MNTTSAQEAQQEILRKVLWDESKEDVLQVALAAGISKKLAIELYDKAWQHRVTAIKSRGLLETLIGFGCLAIAVGVYAFYRHVIGGHTRPMMFFVVLPGLFGVFNAGRGLDRYFLPHYKRGSIACDP